MKGTDRRAKAIVRKGKGRGEEKGEFHSVQGSAGAQRSGSDPGEKRSAERGGERKGEEGE